MTQRRPMLASELVLIVVLVSVPALAWLDVPLLSWLSFGVIALLSWLWTAILFLGAVAAGVTGFIVMWRRFFRH